MTRHLTDEEIREHNRVYDRGWSLTRGQLLLADAKPSGKPGWLSRRRLRQAITCFEAALQIAPESWQSLWALGKIHQRLGEAAQALGCFARAHQLAPSQPDVAREAGIVAIDLGDGPTAVRFSNAAVAASPGDVGLVANLALALLIDGQIEQAQLAAAEAVSRAPDDRMTRAIHRIVDEVASGRRSRPRSGREFG